MRRGICARALVAPAIAAAAVAAASRSARERHGVEPPRGTADRGGPVGRPHGRLRVPQPGQAEHRHDPRERDPGRGSRRRAELVHVLAERAVQPQDRHERGRAPDVIYRFQFQREDRPVLPRRHRPAVHGDADRRAASRRSSRAGTTPPNNIGPRSTPNYRALATKSIVSFDGGASKAFAGQRDDPFFGDIGAIFDLVAIRKGTGNMGGGKDFFAGYGVHTFGVQVPIADLNAKNGTIGVWASVDRRKVTTRGGHDAATRAAGSRSTGSATRSSTRSSSRPASRTGGTRCQPWNEGRFKQVLRRRPILAAVINKLYKLGRSGDGP